MGKQLAHGVDVRSLCQLQGGKGMTEAVEGDVFLDAGSLYPRFEIQCHCTVREILEHLSSCSLATELQSLFADRQDCSGGSLLCDNVHSPAAISQLDDILPLESDAVREAKTCEAGEETCTAKDITLARSLRQLQQLFLGEELPLVAMSLGTHKFLGDILFEQSVLVCDGKDALQLGKVVVGSRSHHALAIVHTGIRQQVVEESLAVRNGKVAETALAMRVIVEVHVGGCPVLAAATLNHEVLEVFQEALLALVAVEEAILLIDDGLSPAALDDFRFLNHTLVVLLLKAFNWVGVDVKTKVLPA